MGALRGVLNEVFVGFFGEILACIKMLVNYLVLCFAILASAHPQCPPSACKEVNIPIKVSNPRFLLSTAVKDDWDATALTFNLTRRDFTSPADAVPISAPQTRL